MPHRGQQAEENARHPWPPLKADHDTREQRRGEESILADTDIPYDRRNGSGEEIRFIPAEQAAHREQVQRETAEYPCDLCREERQLRQRGRNCSQHEPDAPAQPEVSDGAPEKIDGVRQRNQRNNAGAAGWIDALAPQQIGERAADQADGHDGHGRDEEIEQPGTFVWRGWSFAFGVLTLCRLHEG